MTRECGGCTACCFALAVPALDKPSCAECRHVEVIGGVTVGCGIYARRPDECRTFECAWLSDSGDLLLRAEERPDRVGIVVTLPEMSLTTKATIGGQLAIVYELFEGAAKTYRAEKVLQRLERRFVVALVWKDTRRLRLGPGRSLPPRAVELLMGNIAPGP